ncbi:MAG: EscU/YscU/HrcU family type III secretion system export apparatus switch protein [Deltaproteobacteria bacterium]|nr:EscU/YscU/HrcU family type III secretion system export apparatus switch protein [Deltaproteobacteria bacterium]
MKNFEPTEQKIRKEKSRGHLLRLDFTEAVISILLGLVNTYFCCSSQTNVFTPKDMIPSIAQIALTFGVTYSSVSILFKILLNKGVWIKKERSFQFANNFKTFFTYVRKALLITLCLLLFLIVAFYGLTVQLFSNFLGLLFLCSSGLVCIACLTEILLEPVLYRNKLKMDYKELKDEIKETEGDPHVRSELKRQHRIMLFEEVRARVQQCKFIVIG